MGHRPTLWAAILRTPLLRNFLLAALGVSLLFPLYETYFGYPRFRDLLLRYAEAEAQRVTHHLSRPLLALPVISRDALPADFAAEAETMRVDYALEELKVFSADGVVVYSSDPADVGQRNTRPYFRDVVASGQPFTKLVRRDTETMESRRESVDVVESYIPIMSKGRFVGAFEVYLDISPHLQALDRLLMRSIAVLVAMGVALLLALLGVMLKAAAVMRARDDAEAQLRESEERFRSIAASAQDAIVEIDRTGSIALWNRAAERIFGYPAQEALGRPRQLIALEGLDAALNGLLAQMADEGAAAQVGRTLELVGRTRDQRDIPVEASLAPLVRRTGHHGLAILRDITERKAAEQQLELGSQVIQHAANGIIVTDERSRIQLVNPAFTRVTGYSAEEVLGKNPSLLKSGRHDAAFYKAMWDSMKERGAWEGEIWDRRKNGEIFPEWLSLNAIRDRQGTVGHYVAVFTDISERKAAEQDLQHLAFHDPLTGLVNRLLLREQLAQSIRECSRNDEKLAVLYLDLDLFKKVNDTYGHETGDKLLQSVARRLTATVRAVDTVARLGGDEFAVVVRGVADIATARGIAGKIVEALRQPFFIDGTECSIGCSVGIALYPEHGSEVNTLLSDADEAMYLAKRGGGNRDCVYGAAAAPAGVGA